MSSIVFLMVVGTQHNQKSMIESSQKVISQTISKKINAFQSIKVCDVTDTDMLITELSPDDPLLEPYNEKYIEILRIELSVI